MKKSVVILSIIVAVLTVAAVGLFVLAVPLWDALPPNHIRVVQPRQDPNHLDLLLTMQGQADFNFRAQGGEDGFVHIMMHLAYFQKDELILRETVMGMGIGVGDGPVDVSGSILWGIATPQAGVQELRARVIVNGASSQGNFDLSRLDFQPMAIMGPNFTNEQIVPGQRYVVQMQNTSGRVTMHDQFDPEILRDSEHTVILYIIFE